MNATRSTCPYCGVGCGVIIESDGQQITGVRGDPDHPANRGKLCTKGSTLHLTAAPLVAQQTRLLYPQIRRQRGLAPERVTWGTALDHAAQHLARIAREHGPDALGFYISGQLLTEDYYVFNKLAKGLLGTNNVDTNSRLCMSSAVAAYKLTLGADAPPACYQDVDMADCLFIAGSNAAYTHPVLFRRIEAAKQARPDLKVIVVDPRRTDTAELADLHLALQPGTDVMLCHGLLHIMLWEGWVDTAYIAAHTTGFEALKDLVRDDTPSRVAQVCGLKPEDLFTAARWFAGLGSAGQGPRRPTLSLYCQGLNQSSSGTAKNAALINLHLATGQIGRHGAGPLSLTGQPNAMGGREVGGLANLLSAHRDMRNPVHRAEVAALWGVADVPAQPGKAAVEMFQAAADGAIKALWIACTNPAQSMPDQATVRRALERAELVVVQEAFATTATCEYADLLLPATTWGEKEGTVTNSERCISRVRAAVAAPAEARHDWQIVVDLAGRLAAQGLGPAGVNLFPYQQVEEIWNEHRESTRGRDLDITGLSYLKLQQDGPQQWPLPEGQTQGQARLYEQGRFATADGKARFAALPYQPVAEPRDARRPFSLLTGRLRDQWHGMSRTGTLGRLFGHVAEPCVQMHPEDMARQGLAPQDLVQLSSQRGAIVLPVEACATLQPTQVFVAMHWGAEYLSGRDPQGQRLAGVNALTTSAHCPVSGQPELKHAAVSVQRAELPWALLGVAWLPDAQALAALATWRALMPAFEFASCAPFGRDRTGVLLRAAALTAPAPALLERVESILGLAASPLTLRYTDPRRQQHRGVRLQQDGEAPMLEAFLLSGDTRAEPWLKALLQQEQPVGDYGRLLLKPSAVAPVAVAAKSPQVCACANVSEDAIRRVLHDSRGSDAQRVSALQAQLACGTHCGSCLPELRRLARACAVAAV